MDRLTQFLRVLIGTARQRMETIFLTFNNASTATPSSYDTLIGLQLLNWQRQCTARIVTLRYDSVGNGTRAPRPGLHIDWLPIPLPTDILEDTRVKVPIFISTAHYYLDDLYEDLGPTKFVPGSHLSDGDRMVRQNGKAHQKRVSSATVAMS